MKLRRVSERICAETGADFTEALERLCWISLECGAFASVSASGARSEGADVELDLLSAAAYLGHQALAKTLLQSGRLNPSQATEIFDSPMTFAAWGGHSDILRLFQEHQGGYRPREINTEDRRPGSQGFDFEGNVDPGAIVGAACSGDIEMVMLAIYPPSRHNPETTSFLHEPFGHVGSFRTYQCLAIAKEMARDLKVYQFLAAFLGQYDNFMGPDYFDDALKGSYNNTRSEYNLRIAMLEERLQIHYRRMEMNHFKNGIFQNGGSREQTRGNPGQHSGQAEVPEDQCFVPCPYPRPQEVRTYDIMTGKNRLLRDLEIAAKKGDIDIVRGLLDDGVGIPADPPYDPLKLAVFHARQDVFDLLVERLSTSDPHAVIKNVTPRSNRGKCLMVRRIITCGIKRHSLLRIEDWREYVDAAAACGDSTIANFLFEPDVLVEFHVDSETADEVRKLPHIVGILGRK